MSKKLKLPLLFALAFLLLALRPSPALAIYWSTPEKINTSSNQAILPNIVTGPNGYLHAAWMELIPGDDDFWSGSLTPGIFYSYWNGDAWSSPTKISQHPSTGWTGFPGIAVTSNDYVHIVWEDDTEVIPEVWGRILYRYYDGNSWSSPISISHNTTGSWSYAPKIVKDSADNFHVIYNNEGNGLELYYTNWNGSTWSTPEKLSVTGGYDSLEHSDIAVDSNNYPHVILWEQQQGIYHTNFNGTSWETPTLLTADGGYPQIVIDNNDNRHVIWSLPWYDPQDLAWKNKIEYVRWDGSWSASPTTISTDAAYSPWMLPIIGITFDSDNNVYVGWGERVGWDSIPYKGVEVSYKRWNGSVWSDPFFLRKTYDLDTPFIYQDKWDNQHITWSEENETTGIWEFWYAAIPVNVKDYNPQAAFNLTLNITGDSLSISPNALTEPATISAQIGPVPASADPDVTTIPRSYTYRPHGTTFITGKEAEAKIYYEDSEVIGSDEANLKVYIWDSSQNDWSSSFTTSVHTNKNEITVTLPHFSLFGIMAPRVKASWLPPISKAETYELKEGSTLPVKFTLSHFDDTPLNPPELAEDVVVVVKNDSGLIVGGPYSYGTGGDNVRYDPDTGQYIANIHTQELGLEPGNYTVEVLIFGQTEATNATRTQFEILERGKVKGTTTE